MAWKTDGKLPRLCIAYAARTDRSGVGHRRRGTMAGRGPFPTCPGAALSVRRSNVLAFVLVQNQSRVFHQAGVEWERRERQGRVVRRGPHRRPGRALVAAV